MQRVLASCVEPSAVPKRCLRVPSPFVPMSSQRLPTPPHPTSPSPPDRILFLDCLLFPPAPFISPALMCHFAPALLRPPAQAPPTPTRPPGSEAPRTPAPPPAPAAASPLTRRPGLIQPSPQGPVSDQGRANGRRRHRRPVPAGPFCRAAAAASREAWRYGPAAGVALAALGQGRGPQGLACKSRWQPRVCGWRNAVGEGNRASAL